MKVRTDFVTNSSSTSFVCWGVSLDKKDEEKFEKLSEELQKELKEECELDEYEVAEHFGLAIESGDMGIDAVGLNVSEMKDEETLLQFKERAAVLLTKFCGNKIKASDLSYYEEAYFS